MKKTLGIVFITLLFFNNVYGETVSQRLDAIEKRLEKIEELLNPLFLLKENVNSLNTKVDKEQQEKLNSCIKINDIKNSVINDERYNEFFPYVEYSWMISYSNSCDKDVIGTPTFSFLDKDKLILHEAMILNPVLIPAKGSYNAKGTEMLTVKEKIDRLHSSSAGLKSLRFK